MDRPETMVPYIEEDDGTLVVDVTEMARMVDKVQDQVDTVLARERNIIQEGSKRLLEALLQLKELVADLELRASIGVWQGSGEELDHDVQCSQGVYERSVALLKSYNMHSEDDETT
jgi:hypothetical protein